jgi:hypothetical protein
MPYPTRNERGTAVQARPQLANLRASKRWFDSIFIGYPFGSLRQLPVFVSILRKSGQRSFKVFEARRAPGLQPGEMTDEKMLHRPRGGHRNLSSVICYLSCIRASGEDTACRNPPALPGFYSI